MKSKNLEEILKTDSFALISIITKWKEYDRNTVLLSLFELKKRNIHLDTYATKKLSEFTSSYGGSLEKLKEGFLEENNFDNDSEESKKAFLKENIFDSEAEKTTHVTKNFLEKEIVTRKTLEKYPTLRTIIVLLQLLGFLTIIGALIVVFTLISKEVNIISLFSIIIYGGLAAIFTFALAEIIKVIIDIEKNTRK